MKLPYRSPLVALVGALLSVSLSGAGVAAPLVMSHDRSDNSYSFSYDAASGEIGDAASALRIRRDDPVAFVIYIRENEDAEVGERLKAQLLLGLNKKKVVRYNGTFSFEITDGAGTVVYSDEANRLIVLRPKPGERRARLTFLFDLPSGSYSARGFFDR
ncbi:MAG: hypothetical protein M3N53_05485 [Actinomycetota bacterium]|nr:hypothetical protein [Actinomycetota bacterium]